MMDIEFVWDEQKNLDNIRKHGVDFRDAVRAYYDPFRQDFFDEQHSTQEETRWIYFGSVDGLVLFVVETEPDRNTVRIISARPDTAVRETAEIRLGARYGRRETAGRAGHPGSAPGTDPDLPGAQRAEFARGYTAAGEVGARGVVEIYYINHSLI
jgi:uncharacterized DUF497 family protein